MVLAPAGATSPLDLVRSLALPAVVTRGERYFRAGAVRDLERGAAHARARVQGSRSSPYEVSLRWTATEVHAHCTCPSDWTDVCKHAVAVAFAVSGPVPMDVAPASRADPPANAIAEAATKEREDRRRSARHERFELVKTPRGYFGTYQVLSQRSRALYDVLLLSDEFAHCSCPDLATSELEACKHIELVRSTRRRRAGESPFARPVAVVGAAPTLGRVHEPLGDVRIYLPDGGPRGVARAVGTDGFVDVGRLQPHPVRALRRLLAQADVVVRPEVIALLDRLDREARWRQRFAAFEAGVRGKRSVPAEWTRLLSSLQHPLHPYQVDGVLFAARARRALLGDDMGLGKTFQSVAAARLLMELGEVDRTVVVCPASLKHQWAREIGKFLGKAVSLRVVEGGRKAREDIYLRSGAAFLILNYEILIKDLPILRAVKPDLVIVDEAQRIKNWNTKTAKAVKGLWTPRALVLTGTPLENRLGELHSIAELLDPRILGPMWRIPPEFAVTEKVEGRVRVVGFRGLDLIRRRLAPVFMRRERSLVLSQLPARSDQTYPVPFTREQHVAHADHQASAARIAAKKHLTEADVLRLLAELTNMRLVANGLLLYEWDKVERTVRSGAPRPELMHRYPSPKLDEVCHVLEGLLAQRGTKVVVFSQWERMLRLAAWAARPVLEHAKVRPLFFHGQLTSRERAEAIADFHDDPAARVFFSTDAGGVGLNLQEAANALVHLEMPWNPAVLEQRVGRIHRMGQSKPIQVISLVSENCIEARIAQAVEHKRALFDGLFRGDSDELRFDDEARGSLVERMRSLLDDLGAPADLPSEGIVTRQRAVDEEVRQAKPGVADLTPEAVSAGDSLTFDLGRIAQGLGALLGVPQAASTSLPLTVRRQSGRIAIELPDLPEEAWTHLRRLVASIAAPSVS